MGPLELGSFTFSTTTVRGVCLRTYSRLDQKHSSESLWSPALGAWFRLECAVHSGEVT